MRALLAANLLVSVLLLGSFAVERWTGIQSAGFYLRESIANKAEWDRCELKRTQLLKQIRKEGLWKRLGLKSQPWLR